MTRWAALSFVAVLLSCSAARAGSARESAPSVDAEMLLDLDLLSDRGFADDAAKPRPATIGERSSAPDDFDWPDSAGDSPREKTKEERR